MGHGTSSAFLGTPCCTNRSFFHLRCSQLLTNRCPTCLYNHHKACRPKQAPAPLQPSLRNWSQIGLEATRRTALGMALGAPRVHRNGLDFVIMLRGTTILLQTKLEWNKTVTNHLWICLKSTLDTLAPEKMGGDFNQQTATMPRDLETTSCSKLHFPVSNLSTWQLRVFHWLTLWTSNKL